MKLYNENGYANMRAIMDIDTPFTFVIGGRGTGKTYGALLEELKRNEIFMFMRRTQSQTDMVSKSDFSPFRPIMTDYPNFDIGSIAVSKYNTAFYHMEFVDDKHVPIGNPIGYTCALSTISNMRGFDASAVTRLIYDEFISEKHERPLRNEGEALLNAYETINRNRELKGKPALKLLAMTNANDLTSPIFYALGLIDIVERMNRKKQSVYIDHERGVSIIMLQNSPISNAKRKTSLYKLTHGSEFERMSLDNDFSSEDFSFINPRPLAEYRPLIVYDDICIYRHKSRREYYVTRHIIGNPDIYTNTDIDTKQFKRVYGFLNGAILSGRVFFQDFYAKTKLTQIFK